MTLPNAAEAAAYWAALGQAPPAIRREGRSFYVPSRTRGGVEHRVDYALDGQYVCNCEGFIYNKKPCWAIKLVREEMQMTTEAQALVPIQLKPQVSLLPSERDLALIDKAANLVFAGAVSLPKELNTPQKVAAVMLYGLELGLAPMTAIRHLYIVNGKVQPSTEVMAGLLLSRHPDARLSVKELNDERCIMQLVWPERGVDDTYLVTWEDIKRAGLDKSENAIKYPQDRMRYHCTKRLLRIYAPDVINGLDQSAPIIETTDSEDEFSESELYNEGDVAANGQPYIDVQVDRETGEIKDATPRCSEQQRAAILDWSENIKEHRGPEALKACQSWARAAFPYAIEGEKFVSLNLYDVDAAGYIDVLKGASEKGELPKPEPVQAGLPA